MNQIATIENRPQPAKERKISRRVRQAIDLLVTGKAKTQADAAAQVGLSRERLCRALKEDHIIRCLEQAVKRNLAMSQAPAAATLLRLMNEAKSEHVQKDAATTVLGFNGITAGNDRGPVVNVGVSLAGWVIDLREHADGPMSRTIDATPISESKSKPLEQE